MGAQRDFDSRAGKPGFATRAIHPQVESPAIPSRAISVPLYQTASFAFDHNEEIATAIHDHQHANVYSRLSNPTVRALERAVADLEGAEDGVGFASGMAAIHCAFVTLCQAGDHVVSQASLYGGSFALLQHVLPRLGIETTFVKNGDLEGIRRAIRPATKVVYAETIGNPALYVADLPALAEIAHARGARLVVDSTFASPYLCRPLEHGADVVVHSASKYLGGHGDLIGGVLTGDPEVVKRAREMAIDTGGVMSPFVAWLVIRGLATLELRMERHSASALRVAEHLEKHARVRRVIYPGLPSHPDRAVAARLLKNGASGMVAFELDGSREDGARVMDRLRLVKRAASLGDAHSLALQPASTSHRQLNADELQLAGISESFIRLSVGLEDVEDLIADLDQAIG